MLPTEKEKMQKIVKLHNEMMETYNSLDATTKEHIQSEIDLLHPAFALFSPVNNTKQVISDEQPVLKTNSKEKNDFSKW